jgi:hypothetical protein
LWFGCANLAVIFIAKKTFLVIYSYFDVDPTMISKQLPLFRVATLLVSLIACILAFAGNYADEKKNAAAEIDELARQVQSLTPDPHYRDDPFILVTLQEAIAAKREGSGGIGACLVRKS